MRALTLASIAFLCSACTVPSTVETLRDEAPPPELGRPAWVRAPAGFGAWIGAAAGAVVSVATLPITYPISLLADEPLGYSRQEFLFAPVTSFASGGHFLLGAPFDMLDYTFRRAWVDTPTPYDYEFTPMKPPVGGGAGEEPKAGGAAEAATGEPEAKAPPPAEEPPPHGPDK